MFLMVGRERDGGKQVLTWERGKWGLSFPHVCGQGKPLPAQTYSQVIWWGLDDHTHGFRHWETKRSKSMSAALTLLLVPVQTA